MKKLVALACLLLVVSSSYAALRVTTAPSFARPTSFATGRLPESVAIGDLNGDARPDLVTANDLAQSVSVLLSRADGGFHVKADYRTGVLPRSVAIGDLNSDGKPDLATANQTGSISLLVNRGDGTFGRQTELRLAAAAVAIGDLNSDGNADLAVAGGYHVSVVLNGGGGTFRPPLAYQTGADPSSVAIGDLNGDGRPDLTTANWGDDTISVLLNRADGSFQPKHDYGAGIHPESVAIGDLNGDSKPDVVAANGGTKEVTVFLNRGQGILRLGGEYATGGFALSAAIGDLNGDGKPDVAATTYPAHRIAVLVNRGDGRFQPRLEFGPVPRASALAIGDLNADGRPDLAIANGNNTVSVFINSPGRCTVQDVEGKRLSIAKRAIARANCRGGKIRRAYSKTVERGRVISQKPKFGAVLPAGGKLDFVVSLGRRRS